MKPASHDPQEITGCFIGTQSIRIEISIIVRFSNAADEKVEDERCCGPDFHLRLNAFPSLRQAVVCVGVLFSIVTRHQAFNEACWNLRVGFEHRSKYEIFGLPLVHVAFGYDPRSGLPRIARGIIAIGNSALGVVAIGGIAAGGVVLSGIGLGLLVIAGIAVGWIAVGGIAIGTAFALGGLAISFGRVTGGLPLILNLFPLQN